MQMPPRRGFSGSFIESLKLVWLLHNVLFFLKIVLAVLDPSFSTHILAYLDSTWQFPQKACWHFDWNRMGCMNTFGENWHCNDVESSDPWTWFVSAFILVFKIFFFQQRFLVLTCKFRTYSASLIRSCSVFFEAMVNGILKFQLPVVYFQHIEVELIFLHRSCILWLC